MRGKTCFKCNTEKPRSEFYKHAQMGDGLLGKCKECTKKDVMKHRAKNLSRIRAYDRARGRLPHRIALSAKMTKQFRAEHPERWAAQIKLNNALRDGKIKRQPCWVCGAKAVAHHPDYSQPLDVVWLCQIHHKAAHMAAA